MVRQRVLLVYDITSDKARNKIADACLDYGLDRIQFSAFAGSLSRNHQEELVLCIRNILGNGRGTVTLFPICARDWSQRLEIENVG
jgi:CRISPR-associated protein Cas2